MSGLMNKMMRKEKDACKKIMLELFSEDNIEFVWAFRRRFNANHLRPDSDKIKPLNLQTVWLKLNANVYKTIDAFVADIQLIIESASKFELIASEQWTKRIRGFEKLFNALYAEKILGKNLTEPGSGKKEQQKRKHAESTQDLDCDKDNRRPTKKRKMQ